MKEVVACKVYGCERLAKSSGLCGYHIGYLPDPVITSAKVRELRKRRHLWCPQCGLEKPDQEFAVDGFPGVLSVSRSRGYGTCKECRR